MADRYWVGGTGNWDSTSTTNWATSSGGAGGASAPTSADNVIFDANSNTGTNAFTVTVAGTSSAPSVCNDFTTGGAGGALDGVMTLAFGGTAGVGYLNCHGSMTLPATNFSVSGTPIASGPEIRFKATTTGKTITTNGVTLAPVNALRIDGVGGGWTLGSALTANGFFLNAGTLNTGNYNCTINSFQRTTDGGSTTLTLGSSTITASGTGPIAFSNINNFTFNANTSQINLSGASPTFTGGGFTFYNVSFTNATAGLVTMNDSNTFNNLTFTSRSGDGYRNVAFSANQTISGALTLGAANSAFRRMFLRSNSIGVERTITCNGTLAALADIEFRNIKAAGSVARPWTGTRLGNCLGNSDITFTTAADKYWNQVGGGNFINANAWALSSGGAVNVNNVPLPQDKIIIENTGLNTGATISISGGWNIGELNFSTRTNAVNLTFGSQDPVIYKNLVLSSAVTFTTVTGTPSLTFAGQGTTQNITSAGVTVKLQVLFVNSPGGTVKLLDNLTVDLDSGSNLTGQVRVDAGTLDLNDFDITCYDFSSSNSSTRVIDFGTGEINIIGNNATVLNISNATGYTYLGTPVFNFTYSGSTGTRTIAFGTTGGTNFENIVPNINITAGTDIISTSTSKYKNLNFTGFSGTLSNNTRTIFGNLTVSSGMTLTAGGLVTIFEATSGTQEITTNGKTLDFPITAGAVGGTVEFKDALTIGSTKLLDLNSSTIKFKNGTTNSVGNLAIAGTVSNQVVIQSSSPNSTYTLTVTSGPVNAYYATITDCIASPITLGTQLLGNASFSGLIFDATSVVGQVITACFFKPDGNKMYATSNDTDAVHQFELSKSWSISTASYTNVSFSVAAQDTDPRSIFFKDDGTKMYVGGSGTDAIYQYSLSSAWDLSTASYTNVSFSVAAQDTIPNNIFFKPDGTKMYLAGYTDDVVFQYSLSSAWDLSTASYTNVSFSVAAQDTFLEGLTFTSDGTKMLINGSATNQIYQYSLSTPWDLSNVSYNSLSFFFGSQSANTTGLLLKEGGNFSDYILYVVAFTSTGPYSVNGLLQYNLGNKFNFFTGAGNIYSYGNINGGNNKGINFTPIGTQAIPFF